MKIYFETIENELGRQTHVTGDNKLINRFVEIKDDVIETIKSNIQNFSASFSDSLLADETTIEFSFCVSSEGNLFILSGNSSLGIKVKLKWEKE